MANIKTIEGVGEVYAKKLALAGITTTASLLEKGHTVSQRQKLAEQTGIDKKMILQWVQFADLLRVKGIGTEFADLLDAVGVDTSRELSYRQAENLAQEMKKINEQRRLVHRVPGVKELTRIILSAKEINETPKGLAGNSTTDAPPPGKKKIYGPRIEY